MKRTILILTAFLVCLVNARAQHKLDSVEICVLLYPDGHAYVQEERTMDIGNEGTECFIKFNEMDGMSVSLEEVHDETGEA